MSDWYYSDYERNRHGPVAARDLADLHHAGQLQPDTLVWREGMPQWRPWSEVMTQALNEADGRALPAADAVPLSAGVNPYAMAEPLPSANLGREANIALSGAASPGASSTLSSGTNPYAVAEPVSPYAPPEAALRHDSNYSSEVVYAGFWKRYAALFIDTFVVGIAYYIVLIAMMLLVFGTAGLSGAGSDAMGAGLAAMLIVVYVLYPVISSLYYVGFESSSLQATLGKLAVGIKVTDDSGHRLGRGNALGRWASHLLCYFTLHIGYIIAGFTDRKRGLHDMVAGTLVVDKWAYTPHPERQRTELGVVAIVMICLSVLAILAYVALILAIAIPAYQGYIQRAGG
jgi:uncharacterized RDD family membrane protein YckC